MQITSTLNTTISWKTDDGKEVLMIGAGKRNYPRIDLDNETIVMQLRALRDAKIISTDIPLPGDEKAEKKVKPKKKHVRKTTKETKGTGRDSDTDKSGGSLSD